MQKKRMLPVVALTALIMALGACTDDELGGVLRLLRPTTAMSK